MVYGELSRFASSDRNSEEKTPCYTKSPMKELTRFMDESPYGNIINELKLFQHPNDGATFISTNPAKKLKGEHSEESISLAELFGRTTPVKTSKRKGPFSDEEVSKLSKNKKKVFVFRITFPSVLYGTHSQNSSPASLNLINFSHSMHFIS